MNVNDYTPVCQPCHVRYDGLRGFTQHSRGGKLLRNRLYLSPCRCNYSLDTGELLRACDEHQPYSGFAHTAGEVLARMESEVGR